jgi:hypothetical protein
VALSNSLLIAPSLCVPLKGCLSLGHHCRTGVAEEQSGEGEGAINRLCYE